MPFVNLYHVNIAMESTVVLFLALLFVAVRRQEKQLPTRKYLGWLTLAEIGLLLCQIGEWLLNMQEDISFTAHPVLFITDKVLFELDTCLFCSLYVFSRIYISKHIEFVNRHRPNAKKFSRKPIIIMALWLAVPVVFQIASYRTGILFSVSETGKLIINKSTYWMVYVAAAPALTGNVVLLLKNRKRVTRSEFISFLVYLFTPALAIVFDIYFYTVFSYVAVAFVIFVVYIRIDIRQSDYLYEVKIKEAKKEAELRDAKIALAVSQVQPHFIYNTLNAIHYLIGKDPGYARTIVKNFSKYLRMNMNSITDSSLIELSQEIDHIKTYLEIEQLRFDDLMVKYDIGVSDFLIPPLSVQPIVENAVRHGICQSEDGGTVTITTSETADSYIITVEDNGTGFDVNEKKNDGRSHIGIENTRKRLKEICDADFKIESIIGIGTKVTITLPKEKAII